MISIARWRPLRELDSLERRVRHIFEDAGLLSALLPATDVYETPDEFIVEIEVPGYEESELNIEVADHTLTIAGERTEEEDKSDKTFRQRGRLMHEFERRFDLPRTADTEHVEAVFERGVLTVRAAKRTEAETSNKVAISEPGRASGGP